MKKKFLAVLAVLAGVIAVGAAPAHALHSTSWASAQSCNGRAPLARAGFWANGWDYDGLNALYGMYNPGVTGGLCATVASYWIPGTGLNYFDVTNVYRNGHGCPPGSSGQILGFKDITKVKDSGDVIAMRAMTYFTCP